MAEDDEGLKRIHVGNDEFAGLIGGLAGNFIESQIGGGVGQVLGGLLRGGGSGVDRGTSLDLFTHFEIVSCDPFCGHK